MSITHADAGPAQMRVRHDAHGPALTDDADGPVARLDLAEQGRKACDGAIAEICHALRVRPDDPHPGAARGCDDAVLDGASFGAGFTEPGGEHHRDLDTALGAVLNGRERVGGRHGNDGQFRTIGRIAQAWKSLEALDLGSGRIDREDAPAEAEALHVAKRPPAHLVRLSDAPITATQRGSRTARHHLLGSFRGAFIG
jgi:hypothetical protein